MRTLILMLAILASQSGLAQQAVSKGPLKAANSLGKAKSALGPNLNKVFSRVQTGNEGGGGGDICEERIQNIRNDLKKWIQNGGAQALTLPTGITLDDYRSTMLAQINKASIRCVGKGDDGYPVTVDNVPKICRFDRTQVISKITCDFEKMMALDESNQYVLVHHEYAGLAGLELPNGATSDYKLSTQLTSYLEDRVIKRLAVKPPPLPSGAPRLRKLEGEEFELTRRAFTEVFLARDKAKQYMACINSVDYKINPIVDMTQVVSQAEEIFRSDNRTHFQFVITFNRDDRLTANITMNASGTNVLKVEKVWDQQIPEAQKNFGTVTRPDFRIAPAYWRTFSRAVCTP